jgi:hypothetical protein
VAICGLNAGNKRIRAGSSLCGHRWRHMATLQQLCKKQAWPRARGPPSRQTAPGGCRLDPGRRRPGRTARTASPVGGRRAEWRSLLPQRRSDRGRRRLYVPRAPTGAARLVARALLVERFHPQLAAHSTGIVAKLLRGPAGGSVAAGRWTYTSPTV